MIKRLLVLFSISYSVVVQGGEPPSAPEGKAATEDTEQVDEVFDEDDVADDVYTPPSQAPEAAPETSDDGTWDTAGTDNGAEDAVSPDGTPSLDGDWDTSPEAEDESDAVVHTPPPPPNPCEGVTCGGQGTCTVISGNPACACFPGFVADNVNGLTCVTYVPPTETEDSASGRRNADDTEYRDLRRALEGYRLDRALSAYKEDIASKAFDGLFEEYLKRRFTRNKITGIVVLSSGVVGVFGAIALHVAYGDSRKPSQLAGAAVMDVVSLSLMAGGAVMVAMAERRSNQLKRYEQTRGPRWSGIGVSLPSVFVSPMGGIGTGVGVVF